MAIATLETRGEFAEETLAALVNVGVDLSTAEKVLASEHGLHDVTIPIIEGQYLADQRRLLCNNKAQLDEYCTRYMGQTVQKIFEEYGKALDYSLPRQLVYDETKGLSGLFMASLAQQDVIYTLTQRQASRYRFSEHEGLVPIMVPQNEIWTPVRTPEGDFLHMVLRLTLDANAHEAVQERFSFPVHMARHAIVSAGVTLT